jgi:subtilisin-like proprotein convertase family protein
VDFQGTIVELKVSLEVRHTFVGDLVVRLKRQSGPEEVRLINRPGWPNTCPNDDIDVIFSDSASAPANQACDSTPPAIDGTLRPDQPLSAFAGDPIQGDWTLSIYDAASPDGGSFDGWCLIATVRR